MVYVVVAFLLARRERWAVGFTRRDADRRTGPGAELLGRAPAPPSRYDAEAAAELVEPSSA